MQAWLMKCQLALEDIIHGSAEDTRSPAVIICDRGLMDSAAYVGFGMFHRICETQGWHLTDLRDNRYDAVIHLTTAADGAAEFYDLDNPARYETVAEAVETDRKLRAAYVGHNNVYVIGNDLDGGFGAKMDRTLAVVNSLLGLPTTKTRYKKFLIAPVEGVTTVDSDFPEYQQRLFNTTGLKPSNREADTRQGTVPFDYDTNLIAHTYLVGPQDSTIFVR